MYKRTLQRYTTIQTTKYIYTQYKNEEKTTLPLGIPMGFIPHMPRIYHLLLIKQYKGTRECENTK